MLALQEELPSSFFLFCFSHDHLTQWDLECMPQLGVEYDAVTGLDLENPKERAILETDLMQQNVMFCHNQPYFSTSVEMARIEENATLKYL